jgi:WD40 repeat protein
LSFSNNNWAFCYKFGFGCRGTGTRNSTPAASRNVSGKHTLKTGNSYNRQGRPTIFQPQISMYNAFISYSHVADDKFASSLQTGLQKFAKPWYKKRNLEIFLDESSLSASPHLWRSITRALDQSEYLILLASPESGKSKWVNKEIEYWLQKKTIDNILIVLTGGNINWDDKKSFFIDHENNSLPPILYDKFDSEPFYIDLRHSRTLEDLTLANPIFKKEILKLAAKLHRKQPNDFASEEVTVHRKMIRVRNSAIGLLALLLCITLIAAWLANKNADEAKENLHQAIKNQQKADSTAVIANQQRDSAIIARKAADQNALNAKLQTDTAQIERDNAFRERQTAIDETKRAQANYLISEAKSAAATDPTLGLRFAEEALKKNYDDNKMRSALKIYSENSFYRIVEIHREQIKSAVFSSDGTRILTACNDRTARLWDINGKAIKNIYGHSGAINCVAFSPTGKRILTGSSDSTACLWDSKGSLIHRFEGHFGEINSVAFSPDEKKILTGSSDKTVCLWDMKGNILKELKGHYYDVTSVAFSPAGDKILTGSFDNTSCLWNLDGTLIKRYSLNKSYNIDDPPTKNFIKGRYYTNYSCAFSPNGNSILLIFLDGIARLFDLQGNIIHEFNEVHSYATSAAFSPDGEKVLISSIDHINRLLDLTGNVLEEFKGHADIINSVTFSPNGKRFLTSSKDGTARLWSIKNYSLQFKLDSSSFASAFFLHSSKTIFAGTSDRNAYLFDSNGKLIQKFIGYSSGWGNSDFISPDGKGILSLSMNRTATLWDFKGNILHDFKDKHYPIYCASFSPSGDSILTGSEGDKPIRILDLKGNVLKEFKVGSGYIQDVAFSPDGKYIFILSADGVIYLCNIKGERLKVFKGGSGINFPNISLALSPDGKSILLSSWGLTVLMNLDGEILLKKSFQYGFSQITFSTDGEKIAQSTSDSTAIIYDLKGNILQEFKVYSDVIRSLSFSPDGKKILTAGFSGHSANLRIWDVAISLYDFLKSDKIEPLTVFQRKKYGID